MPALRSRKVRARSTSPQPQFRAGVSGAVGCLRAQARVSRATTRSGFLSETRAERSRQRARAPSARIGSGNSHQGSTGKLRLVPQNTVFLRANQRSLRTEKLQLCPDRNRSAGLRARKLYFAEPTSVFRLNPGENSLNQFARLAHVLAVCSVRLEFQIGIQTL